MRISWENVITQYAGMKEEFTVRGAVITTAVVVCVLMGIAHIAAMMTIIDLIKSTYHQNSVSNYTLIPNCALKGDDNTMRAFKDFDKLDI